MTPSDPDQRESDPKQLLLDALAMRWDNYLDQLSNCRNEFSEDAIHDLRVATRRMLALIQLLNTIYPRPRFKKMARALKKQLDEFDDLRDTQVILAELTGILHELPQLDDFEQHLRSEERQMLKDLHAKLVDRKTTAIEKEVQCTKEELETWGGNELKSMILDAVDDAFLTVRQRLGWVDIPRSSTIHRVRVAFKAFRYMVEIVHPHLQNFPPDLLKQMDRYQTLMGNIQDAEVFAQALSAFMKDDSFQELDAVHRYYEKRRSDAISAFVDSMNQLQAFWRPETGQPFPWE